MKNKYKITLELPENITIEVELNEIHLNALVSRACMEIFIKVTDDAREFERFDNADYVVDYIEINKKYSAKNELPFVTELTNLLHMSLEQEILAEHEELRKYFAKEYKDQSLITDLRKQIREKGDEFFKEAYKEILEMPSDLCSRRAYDVLVQKSKALPEDAA